MDKPRVGEACDRAPASGGDPAAVIAALREAGADRIDPVRFRFIETLAQRAASQHGALRRALDDKLQQALAGLVGQHESAIAELAQRAGALAQRFPDARPEIESLVADRDACALRRLSARLEGRGDVGPLADLLRRLDRSAAPPRAPDSAPATPGATPELKALRESRDTWARLRIDRQMAQSQASVPANPGPLNSQLLVLRALQTMQEISPAYLKAFFRQLDALFWLDQAAAGLATQAPPPAKSGRDGGAKSRSSGRRKSR
ncbi:DUF2894 domain-containing protein [Piscinibacter sakaiensis]|uniref:DUF2894 domain-containing protein n=1 Tax=Piscinibacter sakaiensis TaxID=1547922 RepID=UPI003AB0A34A